MTKQTKSSTTVEIGQRFPLTAKKIGINGEGIGYFQHKVTFVPGLLPHEVAVCEVTEVAPNYLRAKIHRLRKQSPIRNQNVPSVANEVGGLEFAHIQYSQQLFFKNDLIKQALAKYQPRGYQQYQFLKPIGATQTEAYRNKAQFPVQETSDGKLICGLYRPRSHDLVDLPEMPTQGKVSLAVCRKLLPILSNLQIPIYNAARHSGIIKALAVRENQQGQAQLTFITNSKKLPHKRALLAAIKVKLPEVISINQNFNPDPATLFWGEETWLLAGQPYLTETLLGKSFLLSPRAFLQLNHEQTEKMYQQVQAALDLQPDDILLDAYAGVGTIGLSLADQVRQVIGIEILPEAVHDAQKNSQLNHITNAHYYTGKVETIWPELRQQGQKITALVVDPPRTGLDQALIKTILQEQPKKFVYLSCNESTLARDLTLLTKKYRVQSLQMIDLFPQTARVETIVNLTLKNQVQPQKK